MLFFLPSVFPLPLVLLFFPQGFLISFLPLHVLVVLSPFFSALQFFVFPAPFVLLILFFGSYLQNQMECMNVFFDISLISFHFEDFCYLHSIFYPFWTLLLFVVYQYQNHIFHYQVFWSQWLLFFYFEIS